MYRIIASRRKHHVEHIYESNPALLLLFFFNLSNTHTIRHSQDTEYPQPGRIQKWSFFRLVDCSPVVQHLHRDAQRRSVAPLPVRQMQRRLQPQRKRSRPHSQRGVAGNRARNRSAAH